MEGDLIKRRKSDYYVISIHSLRMEGDTCDVHFMDKEDANFNPLPPHGGRHLMTRQQHSKPCISIHSLRMEGDVAAACI